MRKEGKQEDEEDETENRETAIGEDVQVSEEGVLLEITRDKYRILNWVIPSLFLWYAG